MHRLGLFIKNEGREARCVSVKLGSARLYVGVAVSNLALPHLVRYGGPAL
jgi:hypothetical protein